MCGDTVKCHLLLQYNAEIAWLPVCSTFDLGVIVGKGNCPDIIKGNKFVLVFILVCVLVFHFFKNTSKCQFYLINIFNNITIITIF